MRNFQGVHNKYKVHFNNFLMVICENLKKKAFNIKVLNLLGFYSNHDWGPVLNT